MGEKEEVIKDKKEIEDILKEVMECIFRLYELEEMYNEMWR